MPEVGVAASGRGRGTCCSGDGTFCKAAAPSGTKEIDCGTSVDDLPLERAMWPTREPSAHVGEAHGTSAFRWLEQQQAGAAAAAAAAASSQGGGDGQVRPANHMTWAAPRAPGPQRRPAAAAWEEKLLRVQRSGYDDNFFSLLDFSGWDYLFPLVHGSAARTARHAGGAPT
ncbi:hypothetical protein ACJQWK_03019 [Exserohilum turcicum]